MRRLIQSSAKLVDHANGRGLVCYRSTDLKGSNLIAADISALDALLAQSHAYWGTRGDHFIVLARDLPRKDMDLAERVAEVESGVGEILVIGYADGGLIVVAPVAIPDLGGQDAAWWYQT